MNLSLLASSLALVLGGLLISWQLLGRQREPLAVRLGRLDGNPARTQAPAWVGEVPLPAWLARLIGRYQCDLHAAGDERTLRRLLGQKLLFAVATPVVVLLPYAAVVERLPSPLAAAVLAAGGFFVPDLLLRQQVRRRRESIFLDLPEAVAVLSLALGAGQSLRRALELAARDCRGPLGADLGQALTLARREQRLSEREALVRVARESGEPTFARFSELLAAKESPYLDFLRQQARESRAEQARYLERSADRAYLAMHAPIAPLLAILVLLIAYGFLHVLAQTIS